MFGNLVVKGERGENIDLGSFEINLRNVTVDLFRTL